MHRSKQRFYRWRRIRSMGAGTVVVHEARDCEGSHAGQIADLALVSKAGDSDHSNALIEGAPHSR
jgi:hypothetical protein